MGEGVILLYHLNRPGVFLFIYIYLRSCSASGTSDDGQNHPVINELLGYW